VQKAKPFAPQRTKPRTAPLTPATAVLPTGRKVFESKA
jgi:hypothetical protein